MIWYIANMGQPERKESENPSLQLRTLHGGAKGDKAHQGGLRHQLQRLLHRSPQALERDFRVSG